MNFLAQFGFLELESLLAPDLSRHSKTLLATTANALSNCPRVYQPLIAIRHRL